MFGCWGYRTRLSTWLLNLLLISRLTSGGKSHALTFLEDGSIEELLFANLSHEPADIAVWSLCEHYEKFNISVSPSPSVSVSLHGQQETDRLSGGVLEESTLID